MSNGWSLQQHVSAVERHMSYNQLWLLKVLQHLKWEEKLGFRPFDNTFVSVLQCSTEAFHCVQSARKEVVWVWIEGDIENVLPLLLVCFNELQTRKRENRQHNRKVAEYVLILILPPPPPFFSPPFEFFLEFWRYIVFIFRWDCLFWYFTGGLLCFPLLPDLITWAAYRVPFMSFTTKQSL